MLLDCDKRRRYQLTDSIDICDLLQPRSLHCFMVFWIVKSPIFTASPEIVNISGMSTMRTYDNLLVDLVVFLFIGAVSFWILINLYFAVFGYRGRPRIRPGLINALISDNLRRLHFPPQLTYMAGGRFQGFRVQLSVLNRELELDDHPPIEVCEVPEIPSPSVPAMSADEINELPSSKYRPNLQNKSTSEQGSSSSASAKGAAMVWKKCMICMDFMMEGDLFRILPCDHEFHAHCIDRCLRRRSMCPVCKTPAMRQIGKGGSTPSASSDHDGSTPIAKNDLDDIV